MPSVSDTTQYQFHCFYYLLLGTIFQQQVNFLSDASGFRTIAGIGIKKNWYIFSLLRQHLANSRILDFIELIDINSQFISSFYSPLV